VQGAFVAKAFQISCVVLQCFLCAPRAAQNNLEVGNTLHNEVEVGNALFVKQGLLWQLLGVAVIENTINVQEQDFHGVSLENVENEIVAGG
jgi:hypothetical protein